MEQSDCKATKLINHLILITCCVVFLLQLLKHKSLKYAFTSTINVEKLREIQFTNTSDDTVSKLPS